jgi:hypothetical protein
MTLITITDAATAVPVLAFRLDELEDPAGLLQRAGYRPPADYLVLVQLHPMRAECDPFLWPDATMREAHLLLEAGAYERLRPGDVLDVREARERRAG